MSLFRRRMMMQKTTAHIRTELEVYENGVNTAVFGNSDTSTTSAGFRIVGSYDDENGYSYPISVSRDSGCAALVQKYNGVINSVSFSYNGETWYVTNRIRYPGTPFPYRYPSQAQQSGCLLCINDVTSVSAYSSPNEAAKDLLDYYYGVI